MSDLIKSDYVIIGSGLAGLYAAYRASKYGSVALLTKHSLQTSSSFWAQGGIASAIGEDDSPQIHFDDTITAGRGLCNINAVKILVSEGPERINQLISEGLSFDKAGDKYELGIEGGHSQRRILHLGGNETGKYIVEFLINKIRDSGKINIFENFLVSKLKVLNDKCSGCSAFSWEERKSYAFVAKTVLIATGGAAGIYKRSTNPDSSTGDGAVLSYNAGTEIANMEFIQFHPSAFHSKNGITFLISEAVRGEGAYLLNNYGKRFMQDYHNDAELAPRDVVSKGIFETMRLEKTDCVYLSLSHLDKIKIKKRFRNIYDTMLRYNIDITTDLIPVSPAAHYMIGGINTDLSGETKLKGLYACGEIAYNGVHGANRLASNSLLECLVFSYRAVEDSKKYSDDNTLVFSPEVYFVKEADNQTYLHYKELIQKIMNENAGIIRSKESLEKGMQLISGISENYKFIDYEYYSDRLKSLILVATFIINGAIEREETRGCQTRVDFPEESRQRYNVIQSLNNGVCKEYIDRGLM